MYNDIKNKILPEIKSETEFLPRSADWETAQTIGAPKDEY